MKANNVNIPGEFLRHEPCEKCGSSDAKAVYSSGTAYCFSCETYFKDPDAVPEETEVEGEARKALPSLSFFTKENRGIKPETFSRFGYGWTKLGETSYHAAPYRYKGKIVAYHLRSATKEFPWCGQTRHLELFGQHLCKNSGEYRTRIVITEGELDCLSVSQAFGNKWQVVSLPSGAQSAKKYLEQNLEFLEGYSDIVLGFDNDEAGRKAVEDCINLFTPGKVRIADWSPYKDANELLQAGQAALICQKIYDAQVYRPDGILDGTDLWDIILTDSKKGLDTPYPKLTQKLLGLRKGELILATGASGLGKSSLANELAFHLLNHHNQKIGVIALEENVKRSAERYLGLYLNKPIHLDRSNVSEAELKAAFNATVGSGKMYFYDHFGSMNTNHLLSKIRYFVKALGVDWIILDHISIVISGNESQNERKDIDILMTSLRSLISELNFGVIAISHIKRTDHKKSANEGGKVSLTDLRGSGSLEQLSDAVICLVRDQQADDEVKRNTSQLYVLKNRYTGDTGAADTLFFSKETGRLLASDLNFNEGDF